MKYKYTKKMMIDFIDRAENEDMLKIAEKYIDLHAGITFTKSAYCELLDLINRQRNIFSESKRIYTRNYKERIIDIY